MASVKFYLREPKKNGAFRKEKVSIIGKFSVPPVDINRFNIPTDEKVEPQHWNFKTQRVKSTCPDYLAINSRLASLESDVINLWREYRNGNFEEFKVKAINIGRPQVTAAHYIEQKKTPIWPLFDEYIMMLRVDYSQKVIDRNETIKAHLMAFCPNLSFEDILPGFDVKFRQWLYTERKTQDSTAFKYISTFKTFLKWACDRVIFSSSFLKWKVLSTQPAPIALTEQELKQVESTMFKSQHLAAVRDYLVISCRTGLRISDMSAIRPENFKGNVLEVWMHKGRRQRKTLIRVPMDNTYTRPALRIFERYNFQLPEIIGKNAATGVKLVCKKAGITTDITKEIRVNGEYKFITKPKYKFLKMHSGRHTFGTIASHYMEKFLVKRIMGIRSDRTMEHYEGDLMLKMANEGLNKVAI